MVAGFKADANRRNFRTPLSIGLAPVNLLPVKATQSVALLAAVPERVSE